MRTGIAAIALLLVAGCSETAEAPTPAEAESAIITLPDEIEYPEGIALDEDGSHAFVTGTVTGQLARIDLSDGTSEVIGTGFADAVAGAFPGTLGMKVHGDYIVMAGGRTAKMFIVDHATGELVATIGTDAPGEGLINDVAIVGDTAYFTDTLRPVLWSLDLSAPFAEEATPWLEFGGTALEYGEGANLNGIVATPDGSGLIVGQMNKGLLFHIDAASRQVQPIDLSGERVELVDGLVMSDAETLFVVRQGAQEIVTIALAPDYATGEVIQRSQPEGLVWPATAAVAGDRLIVVNTQFNTREDETTARPFNLLRVPLSELGAR